MAGPTEGFIAIAPDSSGKSVRNVQIVALEADGTQRTTYQQVVSIADATTGQPLDLADYDAWRTDVTRLLRAVVRGLAAVSTQTEVTEDELLEETDDL